MTEIGTFRGFVDRGDPAAHDFELADLTTDSLWHDLDLSPIIPSKAKVVLINVSIKDDLTNMTIGIRTKGNSYYVNTTWVYTQVANQRNQYDIICIPNKDRLLSYVA